MMHAKTAVADGRWARVGSTNLNIASWLGNCELDAVIEDAAFAAQMEEPTCETWRTRPRSSSTTGERCARRASHGGRTAR